MRMLQAMKIDATSLSQMVLGYYSQSLEDSFSDQDDDSDGKDGDEGSCKKSSSARADVQQRRRKKRSVEHAFRIVLDEDVKSYPEVSVASTTALEHMHC